MKIFLKAILVIFLFSNSLKAESSVQVIPIQIWWGSDIFDEKNTESKSNQVANETIKKANACLAEAFKEAGVNDRKVQLSLQFSGIFGAEQENRVVKGHEYSRGANQKIFSYSGRKSQHFNVFLSKKASGGLVKTHASPEFLEAVEKYKKALRDLEKGNLDQTQRDELQKEVAARVREIVKLAQSRQGPSGESQRDIQIYSNGREVGKELAHEFMHAWGGLADHYEKLKLENGMTLNLPTPEKNFENNLMGDFTQCRLTREQIDRAFGYASGNTRELDMKPQATVNSEGRTP